MCVSSGNGGLAWWGTLYSFCCFDVTKCFECVKFDAVVDSIFESARGLTGNVDTIAWWSYRILF